MSGNGKVRVSITRIKNDLEGAVESCMEPHEPESFLRKSSGEVYIKVNGIDFQPYCYTSPEVLGEVIDYCYRRGAGKVFVMENSTQANFTRLSLEVSGLSRAAREHGASLVYLDEGKQVPVTLARMGYDVKVSARVADIMERREQVCYIDLPRLKTHSMTTVTLGIKNQYGLIRHADRGRDHNYRLHAKLADIYSLIQPDFTLLDGTVATCYGHYPPRALHKECLIPFNLLIGGRDTLAVDVVGAKVLGYGVEEVEHLRLAKEWGLGEGDLDNIEITGEPLSGFKKKYPWDLYDAFPHDVNVVKGGELACREGCVNNTLALLQKLYLDHEGKGGFDIVMGKGFDMEEIDSLQGPVLVVGPCAVDEVGERLRARLGRKNYKCTYECNNLAEVTGALTALMKVNPLTLVPLNPLKSLSLMLQARLHRTTSRITPIIPR